MLQTHHAQAQSHCLHWKKCSWLLAWQEDNHVSRPLQTCVHFGSDPTQHHHQHQQFTSSAPNSSSRGCHTSYSGPVDHKLPLQRSFSGMLLHPCSLFWGVWEGDVGTSHQLRMALSTRPSSKRWPAAHC
jgi:hypothetical protein